MKKFLLSATVALFAMTASAQAGAPLYATGDFEASNWNPGEPAEFEYADGVYTLSIPQVASLKISTAKGEWDEFNGGALQAAEDITGPGAYALTPGDGNITLPWAGQWTLTVSDDLATLTLATTTEAPSSFEIYVRGGMNGWGVSDEWKFEPTIDSNIYALVGVEIAEGDEFKIADANWGSINFGASTPILIDEAVQLVSNGGNMTIDYEGMTPTPLILTFDVKTHIFLVSEYKESGINSALTETAPVQYYTIQGVRVANPDNGLYIIKQGNNVRKAYINK